MSLRLVTGRATAGLRRLTARHRWMRWIPVAACSAGLVATAHAYSAAANATRDAWGQRLPAWVATRDIEPGTAIDAALVRLPAAAVPDAAIADERPVDKVAVQRIGAGEVITTFDVGRDGALSLLPDGWRAVAITESPVSGAGPGDRVDVVSDGIVLVEGAIVIEHLGDAILVGAPADSAPMVALANRAGVALLRTGRTGAAPG